MPCYNVFATRNYSYRAPAKGFSSNEDHRNLIATNNRVFYLSSLPLSS
jgi:hypothetical protein